MAYQSIQGSPELAKAIKMRRKELNLTIEEAASRANVGTKTWCRYEAGESIRRDKCRGICKALNWQTLPESDEMEEEINVEEYRASEAWSAYLCDIFGEYVAVSFVIGSDILLDCVNEDLEMLSKLSKGTHIGQIETSFISYKLPEQFLMRYDYDFLYMFKSVVKRFRRYAHYGTQIKAHSVLEELVLYMIVEESRLLMESLDHVDEDWDEWIFDIFGDMDIVTWLYSDEYLTADHSYHFDHWMKNQFYVD